PRNTGPPTTIDTRAPRSSAPHPRAAVASRAAPAARTGRTHSTRRRGTRRRRSRSIAWRAGRRQPTVAVVGGAAGKSRTTREPRRARTPRRPSRTGSRTARAAARPPGRSARSRTGRWGRSLRAPRLTAPARHAAPAARTRRNDERSGASCLRSPREECRAACNICAQGSLDTRAHDASHGSDARRVRCVGHVTHPDGPGMFLASPPLRMNGGSAMPSTPMSPIRVGVAGWDYADWNGVVYPQPKPRGFDPVRYLAGYIDLIEINSTFYRPPRSPVRSEERRVGNHR